MGGIAVEFPMAGKEQRFAVQRQSPYSTYSCTNVMPIDSISQLLRGGSRYGIVKATAPQADTGPGPILAALPVWKADGTEQRMVVITGAAGAVCKRLNSTPTWDTATDSSGSTTFTAQTTDSKRIVFVPHTVAGQAILACAGWTKTYLYDFASNAISDYENVVGVSATVHMGLMWLLVAPRTIKDITGAKDYTFKVSGTNSANDPATGMISCGDKMLIFTAQTCTVMYGNPQISGEHFNTIDNRYGMIDANAWCRGPNGSLYVMSNQGLCFHANPGNAPPVLLSDDKMPALMRGVDPLAFHVSLAHDTYQRGVHIFRTRVSALAGISHFFYKLPEDQVPGGFWPQIFDTGVEPFCVTSIATSCSGLAMSAYTDLVLGGRGGYLVRFDPTVITDDGVAVSQALTVGPFYGWDSKSDGKLAGFRIKLGANSGSVAVTFKGGASAELAFASSAWATGITVTGSAVGFCRPNMRAYVWYAELATTARWAWEEAMADRVQGGRFFG